MHSACGMDTDCGPPLPTPIAQQCQALNRAGSAPALLQMAPSQQSLIRLFWGDGTAGFGYEWHVRHRLRLRFARRCRSAPT